MTATIDLSLFPLRINGRCANHPDFYVFRCQKCRHDARVLFHRAQQKHTTVADQAITEAKHALLLKRPDQVLAEHKLRLAVLAEHQWGDREGAGS